MLPIYQPYLPKESLKYAHDALDSTWISSQGVYIDKAKELLKESIGCKYLIMVNNGTCATHMLALGMQYKYPTVKKIIVPNNVYVAAWNSFLFSGSFELKPVDANPDTWNMDASKIGQIGDDTAILVVHNLGNIQNVPALSRQYRGAHILEDNCEGLFGKYENKFSGTASLMSSVSFFGNKTITSGEGGAVFTNDEELFEYLNSVRGQGQSSVRYIHDKLGYNYRMTNIQAAILYGQLLIQSEIRERKAEVFNLYMNELKDVEGISFQLSEPETVHAQWMFAVRFINFDLQKKRMLELFLFENNIETRPMFYSINQHAHLKDIKSENRVADMLNAQCLILPSFPELTRSQILTVCRKIKEFVLKNKH
ncbi:MAG: DegT/DnrJ/EryC1/StrS aminotransferase family protein [Bacteroidetes bacterium]|nr:MAG: DegT/DnrJ/EryC1/StrS aminotransferase family protein [Bacteroidota bacterium]REK07247.1 MAG: DegT/DnrJ/EryC1/StrS aminotransferase family protein [Bacteroidota bacterium]REK31766.1 MAG: DegT/DnrJ/EryC1/StrS aminotransferase family protein [Bacteroidota bacterium]REK48054.1 MAG: DegT/DnrJ/EryC1/StrS aminotransferase family protein [Bacteroidota bacterium]